MLELRCRARCWRKPLDLVSIPLRRDPDLPKRRGLAGSRHTLNANDAIAIGERLVDDALLRWIEAIRLHRFRRDLAGDKRLKPVLASRMCSMFRCSLAIVAGVV